jgi:RIO kinase 1
MARIVEKLNPRKPSAVSQKRHNQTEGQWGKTVEISEITLDDVRQDAIEFGLATEVDYKMNAGKEASIFFARWKEHPIILKVYRLWQTSQAVRKKGFFAPGKMQALAAKEYDLLMACFRAGMFVPTPVGRVGTMLTMRYIGDDQPAPQLRNVHLEEPEKVLHRILDDYLLMYSKAHYVHGDLSAYNILWWQNRPWIIDVPQAYEAGPWCDMKRVVNLLRRDIMNVLSYFKKYGLSKDPDRIVDVFLSEYVPENMRNFDEQVSTLPRGAHPE